MRFLVPSRSWRPRATDPSSARRATSRTATKRSAILFRSARANGIPTIDTHPIRAKTFRRCIPSATGGTIEKIAEKKQSSPRS
jgi:hypothetical protein